TAPLLSISGHILKITVSTSTLYNIVSPGYRHGRDTMRRIIAATLGLGLTATIALAQEDPDPGIVSPLPDPAADVVIEDAQDGAPAGPPPLTGGTDAAPPVADDAPPTDGTTDD